MYLYEMLIKAPVELIPVWLIKSFLKQTMKRECKSEFIVG